MSIYGAMFSGVTGLAAQSQALGMISDNISNVNTIGYKGTVARFSTLVTEAASPTHYSPGGVRSSPYQKIDRQGLLQGSASSTDIAIVGNGFFVVNEDAVPGIGDDYMFTRAGNFTLDERGYLLSNGYYLQGWRLDTLGNLPANTSVLNSLETVNISNLTGAARQTTNIELAVNLPGATSSTIGDTHSTTVTVYDKQGGMHDLTYTWTKTAADVWQVDASFASGASFADTDTGAAVLDPTVTLGTITFNADGTLGALTPQAPYGTATGGSFQFYVDYDANAATTSTADRQQITLDLGTIGFGDGMTQYGGPYYPSIIEQDGLSFGAFTGITIDDNGIVTALFDNGQQRQIFKLPIATFRNPNGLEARNGNAYLQTERSGDPLLLEANSGGAGEIAPNSLESSTVDLAEEFTNMIITQRAYSASAKIITTADEMLEELIRLR